MTATAEAVGHDHHPSEPFSHLWEGLAQLLDAHRHAETTAGDPWQFAVSVDCLRNGGLSDNELRVLILTAIVDHRIEKTESWDRSRSFERANKVGLFDRSCFVLTETGLHLARRTAGCAADRVTH